MNNQTHTESALHAATAPRSASGYQGIEPASDLLARLFRRYPGSLTLRLWDGATLRVGAAAGSGRDSPFTLVFRNPQVVWSAVLSRDPLTLAEAYFRGELDIEGDFFGALCIKDHLEALRLPAGEQLRAILTALRLRMLNAAARRRNAVDACERPQRQTALEGREPRCHSFSLRRL